MSTDNTPQDPRVEGEYLGEAAYSASDRPDEPSDEPFRKGFEEGIRDLVSDGLSTFVKERLKRAVNILVEAEKAPAGGEIVDVVLDILSTLIEKNVEYGNSALEPLNVMHDGDVLDAIDVRIDDKISRLKRGVDDDPEDVLLDLAGYIILRRVTKRRKEVQDA